ncbi:MAG: Smr/MutS family protein [Sphaerochaetaceae bacterium]
MQERTIHDLAFDRVIKQIERFSLSYEGKSKIEETYIIKDIDEWKRRQGEIDSIISIMNSNNPEVSTFPFIGFILDKFKDKSIFTLEGTEIYNVALYIRSAVLLRNFLAINVDDKKIKQFPVNSFFDEGLNELESLEKEISYILESPGKVKMSHPSIQSIIKKIDEKRSLRASYSSTFIREHQNVMRSSEPSYRDGRIVLPIVSGEKSKIPGFTHSSSSSGSTVYLEPYKLVGFNNDVVMAEEQLQIQISKLLGSLIEKILENEENLKKVGESVKNADFLFTFASWAKKNKCTKTFLSENNECNLIEAKHPLLGNNAVGLNLNCKFPIKAVVLSGPNAGGKTVSIKTVGLFVLLNQICGFLPAGEGTSLPIFDNIFTDIGDDQSIENSLSTFSGHMNQIGYILRNLTPNSLVILDELGSGTDETEGSAIAKAILEYSLDNALLTLVTSHYSALKQFAYVNERVLNASMEFNEKTHKPTFRIIEGISGESHALDTAKRMKLPSEVINKAAGYIGSETMSISSIISDLEKRRMEMEGQALKIESKIKEIAEQKRKNDLFALKLAQKEYFLKEGQLKETSNFVASSRKELENLVRILREGEMTKEKTKEVKQFINQLEVQEGGFKQKLEDLKRKTQKEPKGETFKITQGMEVLCGSKRIEGVIVRPDGKRKWLVAIGNFKFSFKENELFKTNKKSKSLKGLIEYDTSSLKPKLVMDVRGYTLEEALDAVKNQIEACLVHSLNSFSIIHGLGDGILSKGIHEYLSKQRQVSSFEFARPEEGGNGKTYVKLG